MLATESGTLAERPLGSLLGDLADGQFTGIVHIDGSVQRIICLSDGRLYLAMSSPGISLQRALIDAGVVDEDGWSAALDRVDEHGSVVDALLAAGAPRELLSEAIRELTLGTLLELLVPDRDEFQIAEGETHQLGAGLAEPVEAVLDEAGRRLERWGALAESLPSLSTVLRRSPVLPHGRRSIELDRTQWRIVDALDRPLTLATLIERIGLGAFGLFDEVADLLDQGVLVPEPVDSGRD